MTQTIQTYGTAPELDGALSWLNTDHPIRLADIRGKIVLLDFWTYCCINCMHIIPDLDYLEQKYENELIVIGVHSAKFENEKDSENIRQAILRYEIHHPVANDADFSIWKRFRANAWPTLILIDPEGRIVGTLSGEGHRDQLDRAISSLIDFHRSKGTLNEAPIYFNLEADEVPDSFLLYPGKIHIEPALNRLFISDSNHNRIAISDLDGNILDIAGSGEIGLEDDSFEWATFFRPQGMAYKDGILYVADTENHAIRALDIDKRTVSIFGGNGTQGFQMTMKGGPDTLMSSPWDLEIDGNTMYIAMAGSNQLWQADLNKRNFSVFAGNGAENIIDERRLNAQLAQPSGLTYGDGYIYFADSEVSAVRRASFDRNGSVETLVGEGLFEFGDIDGAGPTVRLQHPLGVLYHDGKIYIADTYNHKVKILDPATKSVRTFLGTGEAGRGEGVGAALAEPSGLAIHENDLYIADTNNHRIVIADLNTGAIRTMKFRIADSMADIMASETVSTGDLVLTVHLDIPDGFDLTEGAPFRLEVSSSGDIEIGNYDGSVASKDIDVPLTVAGNGELTISVNANFCSHTNARICGILLKTVHIQIVSGEDGADAIEVTMLNES